MMSVSARRTAAVLAHVLGLFVVLGTGGRAFIAPPEPVTTPEPPRTYLDTTYDLPIGGTVYPVTSASTLQIVLDAAQPGDVIVLSAGVTYAGHFTLRNQSGSGWIYVISSNLASLPPPGTRVTPAVASFMPKIVTPDTQPTITTEPGAHHYRFVGIELATSWAATTGTNFGVVTLGSDSAPTLAELPHHITFDRCYLHGTTTGDNRRGLTMNSASTAVIDSYFEEFHETFGDSQAVVSWNGPGPFKLVNNYISAAGENVMFGGADPSIFGLVPSDIEIRGNFFSKPLTWKANDPSYAGVHWIIKNLLEFKNAQRAVVQGNLFEHSWAAAQNGFAVVLTPRNQDGSAPWSVVQDIAFHQNIVRSVGAGFSMLGTDNENPSERATRVRIRDNLLTDIRNDGWGPGWAFGVSLTAYAGTAVGVDYVTIDHNTILPDSAIAFADADSTSAQQDHFVFTNNITRGSIIGPDIPGFANALNAFFNAPVFTTNALIGVAPNDLIGYPGNFLPPTTDAVGFVDVAGGNYALSPGSPFKNAGTDGRDLGADITDLSAAVSCALTATCSVTAPLIGGVQASSLTFNTATITWTTNQVADSQVEYGLTTTYGSTSALDAGLVLGHAQTVTGLTVATTYHYRVKSRNGGGLTVSPDATFTTLHPPPVTSGLAVSAITASSATIGWTTDQAADSQIEYGPTTAYGSTTPIDPALITAHVQSLSGLAHSTTYHYRVKSRNSDGVTGTSADGTFTTQLVPVITSLVISNIQGAAAAVTWQTNHAADTQIEYGLTTAYGTMTPLNTTLSTSHGQALSGLTAGTLYHLRIRSRNAIGNLGLSDDTIFTTAPAPVISAVGTSGLTGTSAVISWTTDLPSSTKIEYGTTPSLGLQTTLDPALVTAHSQTLTGLTPGITYYFLVRSITAQNALSKLGGFSFATMLPPVIGGVGSSGVTATSAVINWATNQSADSQIEYGPTTAYGSTTALDAALVMAHSQSLTGLTSQTTYHYRVKSRNGGGLSTSGDFTFTTPEPLPIISNVAVSVTSTTSATITWTTDRPANGVVEYGQTTTYGFGTFDHVNGASTQHLVVLIDDLIPGTTFHYRVRSTGGGGTAISGDSTFTTLQPPPVISGVTASPITPSSATIGWTTDRGSDSQIEYGLTTAYGSTTTLDPAAVLVHGQTLAGLAPATTYHYRVRSATNGGSTLSGDFTFTTLVPPPAITDVLASSNTTTAASIGWTTDWPSDSQVEFGLTTAYGSVTTLDAALMTSHGQTLAGLTGGTTYHFRVKSKTSGGTSVSGDFDFTTLEPAPALSNVLASAITTTSATIGWTTDRASTSLVEYGLTSAYGNSTSLDGVAVLTHSKSLAGLVPATIYHYRVISTTNGGTTASPDATFTTLDPAPAISGVAASTITTTAATIIWTTDFASSSRVEYGLTPAYGQTMTLDPAMVISHGQLLSGLTPGATYHYRVTSNTSGGTTASGDFTFTTLEPPPPPAISGVTASPVTGTTATIVWTTDQPADTQVEYGLTTTYGSTTALNAALVTAHSQAIAGLTPGTTYHYRVKSRNAGGLLTQSPDAAFTTLTTPTILNLVVSNIQGASVAVTWQTDQATDTQIEYGLTTAYGTTTPLNTTLSTGHGQALSGLTVGTTYHLRARSRNATGILGLSADVTFTTAAAPVITNVATTSITPTSVVVTWTTDLPSNSRIEYGLTGSYGQQTTLDPTLVTSHSHAISGLAPGTTYFFLIRSTTAQNALAKLGGFTFTTLAAPGISGVNASAVTGLSATINWTTNVPSDSLVEYGLTTAYGSTTTLDATAVTAHSRSLAGLTPLTTYHYRVRSQNAGGATTSGDFTFTTLNPPPVISGVTVSAITTNSVTIGWTTSPAADAQVEYGLTTAYGGTSAFDPTPRTSHANFLLTPLAPATTYHYRVRSATNGGVTYSADATFTTLSPPPVISNVSSAGITVSSATIGWTTDQASSTQVEFGPTTAYGSTTSLNAALVTTHAQSLAGLSPSTTYHYRVLSRNGDALLSTSGDFTFTTAALPVISNVSISNITGATAAVTWTTDQPTDTQIEFGLTTNYGSLTPLNAGLVTGHGQAISGLNVGTTYQMRVRSRNAAGVLVTSGNFTFTTAPAPVISNVAVTNLTPTSVVVTWTTDLPSNSKIEYGLTGSYGQQTTLDPALVTSHSHTISGLTPGTTYFFLVRSITAQNALAKLGGFTFTTPQ